MRFNQFELDIDPPGTPDGFLGVNDGHIYHYAVQEPFEEEAFMNRQFFVSLPGTGSGPAVDIRIGCMWFDSDNDRWQYAQRTKTEMGSTLLDDPLVGNGFNYYLNATGLPATPDTGGWGPSVPRGLMQAVLVKDAHNDPRIFAIHHAAAVDNSGSTPVPGDRFVVQWYVIDPDLANFRGTGDGWDPEVLITGRIDAGTGDRYHPVIAVSPQGVAYIEYTYSDATTYPQIRRALLSNSYTSVASDVLVQAGPDTAYIADDFSSTDNGGWADFADMQSDPDGCGFWSVHTLVHTADPEPCQINARDVWLFELDENCLNANLNGDSVVDLFDMALFNDLFATGARRVDMDTSGTIDATDATLFQNAYQEATGP